MTDAEKWMMAYTTVANPQDVYNAMREAATREARSSDRTATILVFEDGSVVEFTQGEDQTYPDLGSLAEQYEDMETFRRSYPNLG